MHFRNVVSLSEYSSIFVANSRVFKDSHDLHGTSDLAAIFQFTTSSLGLAGNLVFLEMGCNNIIFRKVSIYHFDRMLVWAGRAG